MNLHVRSSEVGPQWSCYTRPWAESIPRLIDCNDDHTKAPGRWLCTDCHGQLARMLADMPHLITELETALRKDVSFVQHAIFTDSDEAPVNFNTAASRAIDRLNHLTRDNPHHNQFTPDAARELSRAVRTAHNIIDRPRDITYLGLCPRCNNDIWADRAWLNDVRAGHRNVACECGYSQTWREYTWRVINQFEDSYLTEGQIVGMFTEAGKPITRKRIQYLADRKKNPLPREKRERPYWRDGNLFTRTVWVYRVGDLLELQLQSYREMSA